MEPGFIATASTDENIQPYEHNLVNQQEAVPSAENVAQINTSSIEVPSYQEQGGMEGSESFRESTEPKTSDYLEETSIRDGDISCVATGTASDMGEDFMRSSYNYETEEVDNERYGSLTSCVGTRWFRAPELLYGSTDYGLEIDLWSLGCIFSELLTLEPLFPGASDIDQLSRIINVLGNLTEQVWPGCLKLPDYGTISFAKVENPAGIEACLTNRSQDEIALVKKLVCYDPAGRATAMELLQDEYFSKEPLPVPISELHVPLLNSGQDEDSPGGYYDYNDGGSDSDFDDFGPMNIRSTGAGFSIQFS